jgi:hypothetical protein
MSQPSGEKEKMMHVFDGPDQKRPLAFKQF